MVPKAALGESNDVRMNGISLATSCCDHADAVRSPSSDCVPAPGVYLCESTVRNGQIAHWGASQPRARRRAASGIVPAQGHPLYGKRPGSERRRSLSTSDCAPVQQLDDCLPTIDPWCVGFVIPGPELTLADPGDPLASNRGLIKRQLVAAERNVFRFDLRECTL